VYGAGFGLQLGTGVVTIVTGSITYVVWACAALSGSPAAGAFVGLTFGLVRALPLLLVHDVHDPSALRRFMGALERGFTPVRVAALAAQATAVLVIGALLVGGA
jgi:hypothetical protein